MENKPDKGLKGGSCNVTACQKPSANYFNKSTRKYYCADCAKEINWPGGRADCMALYGVPLLCELDVQPIELNTNNNTIEQVVQDTPQALPCPLCGMAANFNDADTLYPTGTGWKFDEDLQMRTYHSFRDVPKNQQCYGMHCPEPAGGCGMEVQGDSKQEALAKWNTRAPNTRMHDLVELVRNTQTYTSQYTNGKGELKTMTHYISPETRNAMADTLVVAADTSSFAK